MSLNRIKNTLSKVNWKGVLTKAEIVLRALKEMAGL